MTGLLLALMIAAPPPAAQAAGGRVNLNTAGAAELVTLPGVGNAIAGRIIDSRTAEGPFRSINDLTRVKGIGSRTLEKLRPLIAVGGGGDALTAANPPNAKADQRPPPLARAAKSSGPAKAFVGAVNINTATADELKALPGIGPKTAAAVVVDRNDNGPFRTLDELTRVKGIGQGKLGKIRPFITVGETAKAP